MQWGDKTQAKKRDITILHATQPGLAIAVAERTSRDNLADTVKAFLTDVGNTPRAGLQWPALLANIETLLLGDAYEEVLRCETKGAQGDVHSLHGKYRRTIPCRAHRGPDKIHCSANSIR